MYRFVSSEYSLGRKKSSSMKYDIYFSGAKIKLIFIPTKHFSLFLKENFFFFISKI